MSSLKRAVLVFHKVQLITVAAKSRNSYLLHLFLNRLCRISFPLMQYRNAREQDVREGE